MYYRRPKCTTDFPCTADVHAKLLCDNKRTDYVISMENLNSACAEKIVLLDLGAGRSSAVKVRVLPSFVLPLYWTVVGTTWITSHGDLASTL